MGREMRRVAADWKHPKDNNGHYIPLYNGNYQAALADWNKELELWLHGLRDDYKGGKEPHNKSPTVEGFVAYSGPSPNAEGYMPEWSKEQCTHYMMYENTTEGTPISPAFATPEELAQWLVDDGANAFAGDTATYEAWLNIARGSYAPSMVIADGKMMSGVEASLVHENKEEK